MNDVYLLGSIGTALASDDFLVVFGHRNDEIGGFHFFSQHVPIRLNIRTSRRKAKGNPGQAMNDQSGYCRMVRKVRMDMLNGLFFHFISEPNHFGEKSENSAKTAHTSPDPSQYFR